MGVKLTIENQAGWNSGTHSNTVAEGGKLELGIATAASEVTRVEDTTAEFGEGTLSGVKAESNYLRMVNTPTLQFNGSSTYVWLGNLTALKVSKPRLKAWFRTSSSSDQVIVRWRLHGPCLDMQSGKVRFVIGRTDFTATIVTSPSTYNDGKWHLAEGYFNGSTVYLWVDGTQVASASCSGIGYGSGGAAIGRDGDYSGAYFSGDIAVVEWFNDSTLVKRWKLDEGSDSKAYDQGGSYYNIYNGSWRTNYFNYETNQGADAWRISPAWGGHEVIDGSEISWSTTLPTGASIKVYTGINNSSSTPPTSWTQAASGNAISGAGAGTDLTGKYIWVKAVLTTTAATSTPQLSSLTIKVTRRAKRYAEGTWLAPSLSLTNITNATESSFITNFNSPAGTSIKFYVAINSSGATAPTAWAEQTPNQIINQIAAGGNYSGKWLWMKIALSATDNTKTPEVSSIIMTVGQYTISDIISYTKKMRAASIREAIMSALGYMKNSRGAIYKIITMVRIPTNYFKPSYGLFRYTLYKWERVWIPLGVFWSGDWDAPENEVYAMTTGRDKLEALRRSEFSTSQVYFDITMYDIAKMVLDSSGMGPLEYWIDEELKDIIIPCFWADPLSHREELRRIAEASLGQIYVDRYGIIRIEGFSFIENYKKEICQEINRSSYYNIDRPIKWTEIANKVEVITMPRKPSAEENVFQTEVELEGEESYSFVAFYEDKPVIDISLEIEVKNGNENEIQIDEFTPYVWGAQIAIANKTQVSKEVRIVVKGKVLRIEGRQKFVAEDAESIKENGEILYSFPDNPLIQTPKQARDIANKLIEGFTDPRRDARVSWRGNPSLELGDRILIPDYPDEEIKDEYYIVRQVLEYDGGLMSEITGRKVK